MKTRAYHGRRPRRQQGISPIMFIVALVVLVATVVLVVVTLVRDGSEEKPPVDEPPVENVDPDTPDTPEVPDVPDEPTPTVQKIDVFGDTSDHGGAVFRVGDTGYEYYTYVESTAQKYATCVNKLAENLRGVATVYTMPIPLSSGITLPDKLYEMDQFSDQKAAETAILSMMDAPVKQVPLYDALMLHRTEYIYYRTDHHWSGLGAYYAYVEYCKAAGLEAHDLSEYKTADFTGYLGTFYNDTGKNAAMEENPDTVTAYYPLCNAAMKYTDRNGKTYEMPSVICDETSAPASLKYGAYIYGDNPFTEIDNPTLDDGSACLVVKESFGNAYVPFMPDHYDKTYVIDYRYWQGSITQFVKEHNVKDVLLCNNLSALRNNSLMGDLYGIL